MMNVEGKGQESRDCGSVCWDWQDREVHVGNGLAGWILIGEGPEVTIWNIDGTTLDPQFTATQGRNEFGSYA